MWIKVDVLAHELHKGVVFNEMHPALDFRQMDARFWRAGFLIATATKSCNFLEEISENAVDWFFT